MNTALALAMVCSSFLVENPYDYPVKNVSVDQVILAIQEEIDCRGNLPPQTPIRRPSPNDIALNAFLNPGNITVQFNYYVGMIDIMIEDDNSNVVYLSTADSNNGQVIISTSNFSTGNYTITFSNSDGDMSGDFQL